MKIGTVAETVAAKMREGFAAVRHNENEKVERALAVERYHLAMYKMKLRKVAR